jgi:hypothetical protein
MQQDKNHTLVIDNKALQNVAQFKYLGRTIINQEWIHKEIKEQIKCGDACYHSPQKLSSHLLSKSVKIKIYKTITLPVALYGCVTLSHTL